MIQLANILHSQGFSITIIHTNFNSWTLPCNPISPSAASTRSSQDPNSKLLRRIRWRCFPFSTLDASTLFASACPNCWKRRRLISDHVVFHFTQRVADEFKLPRIVLRTGGAACMLVLNASMDLAQRGYLPFKDKHPPKSVVYVSFGSLVSISEPEFLEVAWGLTNTNMPFLWVVRPGLVRGSKWAEALPDGFSKERVQLVKWAPQMEVLAHSAVGVFWTHNGWNSTLESLCEGVPMICTPRIGDQRVNARWVSDVWRVGLQLEDGMERWEIERIIGRVMEGGKEGQEIRERIMGLREKALLCLEPDNGSSYKSLNKLVDHILSLH